MYSGPLRLLRALTVSATCVALTFAAHLVGAAGSRVAVGSVVTVAGLLMSTVLLTLVLMAFSAQRWTPGRSLVALALGQAGLNAIFSVPFSLHHDLYSAGLNDGVPTVLAHLVAALLIGGGIAVSDAALEAYLCLATSVVGPGARLLSPWRLTRLIAGVNAAAEARAAGSVDRTARWQRPRIQTDLVVLQCLSRRGPPALALAS